MFIGNIERLSIDSDTLSRFLQCPRHVRCALRHLRIVGGQPPIEHKDEFMLAHGHAVRIQESHRVGLHPDKVISEPSPVCVDEVGGEGLNSGDDRSAIGFQDTVELPPHEVEVRPDVPVAVGDTIGRVRKNKVDGAVGNSLDAGFVGFKKNMVKDIVRDHKKRIAIYYTFVKYN